MATTIKFIVLGVPQPQGSKQSFVPIDRRTGNPFRRPGNGGVVVSTVDANKKAKPWMALVRCAAADVYSGELISSPVELTVKYYFARPKNHFGTGRNQFTLKPSAPQLYCAEKPDLDKCDRAIGDSLTDVLLRDDKLIVRHGLDHGKYWTTGQPRAEIEIVVLENLTKGV